MRDRPRGNIVIRGVEGSRRSRAQGALPQGNLLSSVRLCQRHQHDGTFGQLEGAAIG